MEVANTKTTPYPQSESSSETHNPNEATTKSLTLLKSCTIHHHMVVSYKECLKNHAANLGGHALDGCGEFMPSPTSTPTDPVSLKCAACGCHRNFHRRDPYDAPPAFIHRLPPPPTHHSSSPSPTHTPGPLDEYHHHPRVGVIEKNNNNPSGRKRSRTKFSKEQKQKMHDFAERVGWRMPKGEEKLVKEFCDEVGVDRGVLKVWMHNNKNNFGKKLECWECMEGETGYEL
ncbi:hypothetical protein GOBAR_AA19108 [Gossypium barbadense]|uniref:ZF-HD dimerization-type domain-containing protein n=1 Tax=Gossypium barbadense TaxID=3634 RepID=A0A2P5XDZ2_GOSBA|nr:hypothetical protein GOBAR_AA19108 [Gossypium barbadense]